MNSIQLEDSVVQRLMAAGDSVALYDSKGKLLGFFEASGETPMTPELLAWAREQVSDEELDRRMQRPSGISTEELLKRVQSL